MSIYHRPGQYRGVRAKLPPDLQLAQRAPTSADKAYVKGTLWLDFAGDAAYMWPGEGNWISLGAGAVGGVVTLTGDSGGPISPVGGDINILGTASEISVVGTAGTLTISLPAALVAPGSIVATTSIASTTTMTAGTGLTATTGNIVATAGAVNAGTSMTATLGAITATNGNLVLGTAGNKIISSSVGSGGAAGANSFGTATLTGGTVTVSTTAVTASSIIFLTRMSVGATGANDLGMLSVGTIVAATSFDINAWTVTNATALQADDVSVIGWMIVN